jgi:hypothetical protein
MNKNLLGSIALFFTVFQSVIIGNIGREIYEATKSLLFGNTLLELQWLPTGVPRKDPKGDTTLPVKKNMKIFSFRALQLLK